MHEMELSSQMETQGGSIAFWVGTIIMGTAIYKLIRSARGRVSIPRLITLEWH